MPNDGTFEGVPLEYNPYAARYTALVEKASSAEDEKNKWLKQLSWYDSFDGGNASTGLNASKRAVDLLEKELRGIDLELAKHRSLADALKPGANLGWDPRYWFSSERSAKKAELDTHEQALAQLTVRRNKLQQQMLTQNKLLGKQLDELERYRSFDRLEAEAAVNALSSHMKQLRPELEQVGLLKEDVDHKLREPLAELTELKGRKQRIEFDISRTATYEQRLLSAANSYERKLIHDECGATFGESKPSRVIRTKQRELESVTRNIGKLHDRLRSVSQRASRIVKTLVIDGNNLCYQHQNFIGLAALRVVAQRLSSDYVVVIVFDASIRRMLQMRDRDIAARFGHEVRVHVVASKHKADETLLDAAADPHAYVISNDRFVDFPDKPTVREQRLFRHEILNDKVFVHDLSVAEAITTVGQTDREG